jgi:NADPH-dependent glutamate synthase beta subunit-like oxidoreductase
VRVFYDKLEDQNLHLASQLAKQQEDLKSFYKKICDQNEELKQLLKNLDPDKLEELERKMAERGRREEGMQKGASDVFNIVNGKVNMGGGKYRFAGKKDSVIMHFYSPLS